MQTWGSQCHRISAMIILYFFSRWWWVFFCKGSVQDPPLILTLIICIPVFAALIQRFYSFALPLSLSPEHIQHLYGASSPSTPPCLYCLRLNPWAAASSTACFLTQLHPHLNLNPRNWTILGPAMKVWVIQGTHTRTGPLTGAEREHQAFSTPQIHLPK